MPLSLGLSVVYTPTVDPVHLIRTIRDNRVTLLSTVPLALHVLGRALQEMPAGRRGGTLAEWLEATPFAWLRRDRLFRRMNADLRLAFLGHPGRRRGRAGRGRALLGGWAAAWSCRATG